MPVRLRRRTRRGGRQAARRTRRRTGRGASRSTALTPERRAEYDKRLAEIDAKWPPAGRATVKDFVDHIDYIVKLIGIDHVGISSDFDGGGGVDGWNSAAETFNVTLELVRRGYTEEQIGKIWSGNLLRVWAEVEKVAKQISQAGQKRAGVLFEESPPASQLSVSDKSPAAALEEQSLARNAEQMRRFGDSPARGLTSRARRIAARARLDGLLQVADPAALARRAALLELAAARGARAFQFGRHFRGRGRPRRASARQRPAPRRVGFRCSAGGCCRASRRAKTPR